MLEHKTARYPNQTGSRQPKPYFDNQLGVSHEKNFPTRLSGTRQAGRTTAMSIQKGAPFPIVSIDPSSPESLEREKLYAEYFERRARNDAEEKIRAEILAAPIAKPPRMNSSTTINPAYAHDYSYRDWGPDKSVFSDADKTPMEQTTWVILDWLPEAILTLIVGPFNCGKNTIAITLAAAISRGKCFPLWLGATPRGLGVSIISSMEEDFSSKTKPKFVAAGGNQKFFKDFPGIPSCHPTISNFKRPCNFSDSDNEIWMGDAKRIDDLGMIIFDPASQVVCGASSNSKDREGHEKMARFAKELNCAFIGIAHTPKTTRGKDIPARIAGSGAVGQVARSIILISKIKSGPTQDGATHVMVLAKAYGPPVHYGVLYSIVGCKVSDENGQVFETSRIVWHGTIPGTPEEILAWAENGELASIGRIDPASAAVNFVKEALRNGRVRGKEVEKQAKAAGVKTRDLAQAKKELGVKSEKGVGEGQFSPHYWRLPGTDAKG